MSSQEVVAKKKGGAKKSPVSVGHKSVPRGM